MTAYTGTLCPSIFVEDTLRCSATIAASDTQSPVTPMCELESIVPLGAGTLNSSLPIPAYEIKRDGAKVDSFLDDYYYRVHVTPIDIAFGAILAERVETFIVWNAFFVPVTNSSISETFPDEFELTGEAAGYVYKALEYKTYTLTVPKEGSANFEASIIFDFGAAGERTVTLSGVRMVVFYFPPFENLKENLQWFTNIIKARDGSEQRRSVRSIPRQGFNFEVPLQTEKEQSRFEALMHGWTKRAFGLPIWKEYTIHAGTITAGDLSITVDTTNADYRDDSYALIISSIDSFEAIKISTVASGSLTLETAVVGTYTGNKLIMPLRISQVTGMIEMTNPISTSAVFQIAFAVKDNVLLTGYTPALTYNGLPVLTTPSMHYSDSHDKQSNIDSDSFSQDYDSGDFDFYSDSEFNLNSQEWGFLNETKAAMWDYKKFLHSLFGRQGALWVPTFKKDLNLTDTIGAADTSFRIENIKLAENMGLNDLRTHLAFIFTSGTILCREITGIVEADATEEIISIDSALGVEVPIGGCTISFLDKCRLAADEVEIEHIVPYKNYSKVNFLAVKE